MSILDANWEDDHVDPFLLKHHIKLDKEFVDLLSRRMKDIMFLHMGISIEDVDKAIKQVSASPKWIETANNARWGSSHKWDTSLSDDVVKAIRMTSKQSTLITAFEHIYDELSNSYIISPYASPKRSLTFYGSSIQIPYVWIKSDLMEKGECIQICVTANTIAIRAFIRNKYFGDEQYAGAGDDAIRSITLTWDMDWPKPEMNTLGL